VEVEGSADADQCCCLDLAEMLDHPFFLLGHA